MSKYHKALRARESITTIPDGTVRADLEAAIAAITAELKGPLSNTERVMLVHDRDDRRDILALMDARDRCGESTKQMKSSHPLPDAALKKHIAVLGMTGGGKTITTKGIVEHILELEPNARVCILDPIKSDWWGITSSASGKQPGLPFQILGGPRGHVPLHESTGKAIGELVGSGALPLSIIDMADFGPGGLQRFFNDFAPALIRKMKGVVHLVMEEAHEFAPKERAGIGNENMTVYYAKKLATAGRSRGVRLIVASQRTQQLHNALLGSCQTMIAHQITWPTDMEPVEKWLKNRVDKETFKTISGSLAGLATGTAWLCPGAHHVAELIKFPMIKTFDNSATPDGAAEVDVKTAPVDRDHLREIMGEAAKEAEANHLPTLRTELAKAKADLEAEKRKKTPAPAAPPAPAQPKGPSQKEIDNLVAQAESAAMALGQHRGRVEYAKELLMKIKELEALGIKDLAKAIDRLAAAIEGETRRKEPKVSGTSRRIFVVPLDEASHASPEPGARLSAPAPARIAPARQDGPVSDGISRPQQKILDALAWLESVGIEKSDRTRAAMLAGASSKSSGFEKNVSTLSTKGMIRYPASGELQLTDDGRAVANAPSTPPTNADLQAAIRSKISGPQWTLLEQLIPIHPDALSREELARAANVSHLSSGFEKNVSTLSGFGFVSYPERGAVAATKLLFVEI